MRDEEDILIEQVELATLGKQVLENKAFQNALTLRS